MIAEMRLNPTTDGHTIIQLSVPTEKTLKIADIIRNVLTFAGHKVKRLDAAGEEWVSAEEVFPEGSPAMAFRGLRGKEELTQVEMAERLGVNQNVISEMESGKRAISVKMAKRIEQEFGISYKAFL